MINARNEPFQSLRRQLGRRLLWVLLLLAAWALWLYRLNIGDLSFDETATYFVAYRPPLAILTYLLGAAQEHPPLYYVLIRGWMYLVGTNEFALRYFSVLVGMVVLVLVGWLARIVARGTRQSGLLLGLTTAVLLIATPAIAFYARNARMYSLVLVWAILGAGLLLRDWVDNEEPPQRTAVLALMLVNGLSLFTHYYLVLFVITQPLILLAVRRWRSLGIWLFAHSIPALVGGVWLLLASGLQSTLADVLADFSLSLPVWRQVVLLLSELVASPLNRPHLWVMWLLFGLLIFGLSVAWRRQARRGIWLLLLIGVPFVLAYALPREPRARYLIYLMPLAALAVAHGLTLPGLLARRRGLGLGVVLLLLAPVGWVLSSSGMGLVLANDSSRYGQTLQTVQALSRPGDQVLFYGPWQLIPFRYYDPGDLPPITVLPERAPPLLDPVQAEPVLVDLLNQAKRLWVVPTAVDNVDPDFFVWEWLRRQAHAVAWQADYQLFLPPLPDDVPATAVDVAFGDALLLTEIRTEPGPVPAGEGVRVSLVWRTLQPSEAVLETTLLLVDDNGRVWQRMDAPLPAVADAGQLVQRSGLLAPPGAPPGDYRLRLRVVGSEGALSAAGEETLTLATLSIDEPAAAPALAAVPGEPGGDFCAPDGDACVTLVSVEPGGVNFQPGYPLFLTVHWLAPDVPLPPMEMELRLEPDPWLALPGVDATPVLTQTLPLLPNAAASTWAPGRLVSQPLVWQLPPDVAPGRAQVALRLRGVDGRVWTTPDGDTSLALFPVVVEERPTLRRLPAGLEEITVDFGAAIGLRGYRVSGSACPGGQIQVDYAWYARERPSAIYSVFNHIVAADGTQITQVDGWPQGGRLLTTQWQAGEYVEDSFLLDIPAAAPVEPYVLYVGMYDAATGERLAAVSDNLRLPGDRVPLAELTCEAQ